MDGERCLQATPTQAIAGSVSVATGGVAQDDGLNIKEEPTEADLDAGPAALQHMDADTRYRRHKRNVSCVKEERDPLEETSTLESKPFSAKEPLALQVDEDVADSQQDVNGQPCLQATYKPAITMVQDDGLKIKEEWADTDIDIGPTVLQHIDTCYKPVQPDVSIIKQEDRSEDNNINPTQCSGVKEDTSEDERRADTDDQRRNKLYSCDKCVKTYASKASLWAHYRNLHSTESYECTRCKKIFSSKIYLHRHTSYVHSEQQYECAVCRKICRSKTALSQHVYNVHRPRPAGSGPRIFICDYCQKTLKRKANLTLHITRVHASGSYNCSQCNKSFRCEQYLMTHVGRIHTAGSHQLHTCTNCGKDFKSKRNCQRHEKSVKCTRPTASNSSAVASTSRQQRNVVMVKEEPADGELELGPVVFQHMDCNYRPYKEEPQDGLGD